MDLVLESYNSTFTKSLVYRWKALYASWASLPQVRHRTNFRQSISVYRSFSSPTAGGGSGINIYRRRERLQFLLTEGDAAVPTDGGRGCSTYWKAAVSADRGRGCSVYRRREGKPSLRLLTEGEDAVNNEGGRDRRKRLRRKSTLSTDEERALRTRILDTKGAISSTKIVSFRSRTISSLSRFR